jgi:ribonuclease P protein component
MKERSPASRRYRLPRAAKVKSQADFLTTTKRGVKEVRGPLMANLLRSKASRVRLGIRISRRCGSAPVRNRIKRLLREAFRLMQHDWPGKFDLVITVRPHAPLMLAEYQRLLTGLMVKLVQAIARCEASS